MRLAGKFSRYTTNRGSFVDFARRKGGTASKVTWLSMNACSQSGDLTCNPEKPARFNHPPRPHRGERRPSAQLATRSLLFATRPPPLRTNSAQFEQSPPVRSNPPPKLAPTPPRVHSYLCAASLHKGAIMPHAPPAAGTPEPRTLNPEPWVSRTDPVTGAPAHCVVLLPSGAVCHPVSPPRATISFAPHKIMRLLIPLTCRAQKTRSRQPSSGQMSR